MDINFVIDFLSNTFDDCKKKRIVEKTVGNKYCYMRFAYIDDFRTYKVIQYTIEHRFIQLGIKNDIIYSLYVFDDSFTFEIEEDCTIKQYTIQYQKKESDF